MIPTLSTKIITNISSSGASSGGEVTDDGGADITARGVCWSTSQSPTIADSKTNDGIGVGQFTSNLIDLEPNTNYFVRAYATNSVGTSYGEEISFKTANFDIPLNSGWNLISTYIKPQAPDTMNNVMSEISNNLLIAKNNGGQVFIPSYDINTIGRWNVTQGYLVYISAVDTLSISGSEVIPSETPIQLSAGWNTIAYLRNAELSAEQSFASITDNNNLLIAKTLDGKVYIPSYSINTIGNLKPGSGYKVYVSNLDILYYNSGIVNYETVTIGTQEWMTKNLDVSRYRNGDSIRYASSKIAWIDANNKKEGAWCYYDNDPTSGEILGKLYNWYAVNDSRGIAPNGYHVASDTEWTTLTNYLKSNSQYWCNNNNNNISKALAANELWFTHSITCAIGNNLKTNNITGFTALPGGHRSNDGSYGFVGEDGIWWSSTSYNDTNAWNRLMGYYYGYINRNPTYKGQGYSVRCLKD